MVVTVAEEAVALGVFGVEAVMDGLVQVMGLMDVQVVQGGHLLLQISKIPILYSQQVEEE